jgi:hypothetical protein
VMRMVTTLRGRDRLSLQMYRIEEGGTETLITEMDHVRL